MKNPDIESTVKTKKREGERERLFNNMVLLSRWGNDYFCHPPERK
jgi:hypothetical protein